MQPTQFEAIRRSLGPYQDRITLQGADTVPAKELRDPTRLRAALDRMAAQHPTTDLRVAASLWSKQYIAAVASGVLAAMTLHGVGLDASAENVSLVLKNGIPRAVMVHNLGDTHLYPPRFGTEPGAPSCTLPELQEFVLTRLLRDHLTPLFKRLHHLSKLSKAVLWGNAGNAFAHLYDALANLPGGAAAAAEDRLILLGTPQLSFLDGPNPLYNPVHYEALHELGLPAAVVVRHTCCLKHKAYAGAEHCTTCPLITTEERIALIKKDHSRQHP